MGRAVLDAQGPRAGPRCSQAVSGGLSNARGMRGCTGGKPPGSLRGQRTGSLLSATRQQRSPRAGETVARRTPVTVIGAPEPGVRSEAENQPAGSGAPPCFLRAAAVCLLQCGSLSLKTLASVLRPKAAAPSTSSPLCAGLWGERAGHGAGWGGWFPCGRGGAAGQRRAGEPSPPHGLLRASVKSVFPEIKAGLFSLFPK